MIRRPLLVFLAAAAVCLVPWIVYLANTLPDQFDAGQWRTAWVGFDVALLCCFAAATWLGMRRRRAAVPLLAATAALLLCDAWFDVLLDWARRSGGPASPSPCSPNCPSPWCCSSRRGGC